MSHHNLEIKNGIASAVFATDEKDLPWHKLGTMVNNAITWQDCIKLANLDFEVKKFPLYRENPFYNTDKNNEYDSWGSFFVPSYAVVRMDKTDNTGYLGTVGEKYEPIQNKYMFEFVDTLLENINGAHYESAGILKNGEQVWCLARVPYDFTVGKNDLHRTYLLFQSSHDGSMSSTCKLTTVRVVCNNTLTQALSEKTFNHIKVKHTKNGQNKLDAIKETWQGVQQTVNTLKDKFNILINREVTGTQFKNMMNKLFGDDWADSTRKSNVVIKIAEIFDKNDNNSFPEQRGTAFNLLNAITNYTDHEKSVKEHSGYIESTSRAYSAIAGTGEALKQKALQIIYENVVESLPVTKDKNNTIGNILDKISLN
jgi:phage/plasmid-like protein (TIGR03299 family)